MNAPKTPLCVLFIRNHESTGHQVDWARIVQMTDDEIRSLLFSIRALEWEMKMILQDRGVEE